MNGKCFEPGTIQAFLDGETMPDVSLQLTGHVAGCDTCARLMSEAEEENAIVFSTLERELNSLVPTQRLWSRINETIADEKSRTPVWQKTFAYIRISLVNPSIAAAAGIVLVLGMMAIMVTNRDDSGTKIASVAPTNMPIQSAPTGGVPISTSEGHALPISKTATAGVRISNLKSGEIKTLAASVRGGQREITPQNAVYNTPAVDTYLAGEESYVKTISDLRQNVDSQKDEVMTPSSRVSYERDMAVVNDSIRRMREVVKKNPRNQAARQVLYNSYQDKIDLLNSVSEREELMATLR